MAELDFDEFLDYNPNGSGGYLANWKEDGSVVIWLHPEAKIHSRWSHTFFRLLKDDDGDMIAKFTRFKCLEEDVVNEKQRFRDKKTGEREYPAVVCPHCLCIEWIREQIDTGELDWTTPIFKVEQDGNELIMHAGGFTGMFGKKTMSDAEKKSLKKAGISLRYAYKENGVSKMDWVLSVVSNSKPDDGCVVTTESPSLGKALVKCIKEIMDECVEEGGERNDGNPKHHPYAFKLKYDEEKEFAEKYSVAARRKLELTDEIQKIFDQPPPDVSQLVDPPDEKALREIRRNLEAFCLIDMPFDSFFEPAEKAFDYTINGVPDDEEDEEEDSSSGDSEEKEDDFPESWNGPPKKDDDAEDADDDDGMVACDACGKAIPETDMVCKHCGAEYEEDAEGNVTLKPKPKPRRRRSK